ncbi:Hypothetical Protein FCC1311_060132 [Hondaea fermentalgiana]|uniref:Uncharacterized protein n=1 Tax=Hondaea fermentalgiana TaxID=2315210 RepID=A0A2R5GMD0_9STRA|nr:Hypothetical Protein FCC1311_060132 [Hondaea fermentalgiana]|eukprot:GBG29793.1 Hypothetical Protein FCC1311_060132 [Hondaea fermentalgiana]
MTAKFGSGYDRTKADAIADHLWDYLDVDGHVVGLEFTCSLLGTCMDEAAQLLDRLAFEEGEEYKRIVCLDEAAPAVRYQLTPAAFKEFCAAASSGAVRCIFSRVHEGMRKLKRALGAGVDGLRDEAGRLNSARARLDSFNLSNQISSRICASGGQDPRISAMHAEINRAVCGISRGEMARRLGKSRCNVDVRDYFTDEQQHMTAVLLGIIARRSGSPDDVIFFASEMARKFARTDTAQALHFREGEIPQRNMSLRCARGVVRGSSFLN